MSIEKPKTRSRVITGWRQVAREGTGSKSKRRPPPPPRAKAEPAVPAAVVENAD
jgi:hypothetical protein